MTKDFLLRLTEEHYGAGAFPVYGRLLEEQRLTRGGPLLPMWYCTAAHAAQAAAGKRSAVGNLGGRAQGEVRRAGNAEADRELPAQAAARPGALH